MRFSKGIKTGCEHFNEIIFLLGDEDYIPPDKIEIEPIIEPPYGTVEWIQYWSEFEGLLPTPINVSITDSLIYKCPELRWYNFDVYPHKVKLTNTGYTRKYFACNNTSPVKHAFVSSNLGKDHCVVFYANVLFKFILDITKTG